MNYFSILVGIWWLIGFSLAIKFCMITDDKITLFDLCMCILCGFFGVGMLIPIALVTDLKLNIVIWRRKK